MKEFFPLETSPFISRNKFSKSLIRAKVAVAVISVLFPHGCHCQPWSNYWTRQTSRIHSHWGTLTAGGHNRTGCCEPVGRGRLWGCSCAAVVAGCQCTWTIGREAGPAVTYNNVTGGESFTWESGPGREDRRGLPDSHTKGWGCNHKGRKISETASPLRRYAWFTCAW